MKSIGFPALLLTLAVTAGLAEDEPAGEVSLYRAGQGRVDHADHATLKKLAMDLLKSSNFNTVAHPQIMKQSVAEIHDRYRRAAMGDYLVVTFEAPVTVQTVGGDVSVCEVVSGLRPDYADPLFTIDADGRVVAHGKFSGYIAVELRKAVDAVDAR